MSEISVMSHAQVLELESKLVQHNPTTYAEIELNQNLTDQETIKDREFLADEANNGTAATLIIFGLFKAPDAEKVAKNVANKLDPIKSL
ncbi:MAG: hypothetical protein WC627_11500 [Legionella sp.]|jgi:hypothetical protein